MIHDAMAETVVEKYGLTSSVSMERFADFQETILTGLNAKVTRDLGISPVVVERDFARTSKS